MLFAVAAVAAVRAAWPDSANSATAADRVGVIAVAALLAALPLLARWFLGPPDNRAARWLLRRVPGPDTGRDDDRPDPQRAAARRR